MHSRIQMRVARFQNNIDSTASLIEVQYVKTH